MGMGFGRGSRRAIGTQGSGPEFWSTHPGPGRGRSSPSKVQTPNVLPCTVGCPYTPVDHSPPRN